MFRAHVLIVRRSKLYFTVSGIITHSRWPSVAQVERGLSQPVGGGLGVQTPSPEIPNALQNRAKFNPIVKAVKNY